MIVCAVAAVIAGDVVALQPVTSSPVAAAQTLVSDNFNRAISAGFGSATVGGAYATSTTSGLSVDGSRGLIALTAGKSRAVTIGAAKLPDIDALSSFGVSAIPASGSVYLSHMLSVNSAGAFYSPRVRVMPGGTLRVGIRYVAANGATTTIGSDVKPSFSLTASQRIMLRSEVSGSSTATIRVKAWLQGTTEPNAWTVTATSSVLPASGKFGVWGYLASSTPATTISVDDLAVTGPDSTSTPTPAPTATATPTATPTQSTPTAQGKPSASNTGLPAGTKLTVYNGDLTITKAGTVIDGMDIRGFVRVKAPNVTIRRSIVRGASTTAGVGLLMLTGSTASNYLIEDVTLVPSTPSVLIDGIKVNQPGTIRRVDISKTVDGISVYGNAAITIDSSYIHDLTHYTSGDPNQGGGASHDDAIQIMSGNGIRITNNTLMGGYNSAVMITQDTGTTKNVWINNNWIDGGGCSLNYGSKGAYKTGMQANYNRFGRHQRIAGCAIIHNPAVSDLKPTGNVWDDNGAAVTAKKGT